MWLATRRSDVFDQPSMNNPADPRRRRRVEFDVHGCRDLPRIIAAGDLFLAGSGGWWCGLGAGFRAGAVGGEVR